MRMCTNPTSNSAFAVLIVGDALGYIDLYQTPLFQSQRIKFTLQRRFQAHANQSVFSLHFHHHKPLFVSAAEDEYLKVWSFADITNPRLIKSLRHPDTVWDTRYSKSGLLLTACEDGTLRVYGQDPLFSLCWSCKISTMIYSLAWSPSNRICASFRAGVSYAVQVWDSAFQTIFKLEQNCPRYGLVWCLLQTIWCYLQVATQMRCIGITYRSRRWWKCLWRRIFSLQNFIWICKRLIIWKVSNV